MTARHIANTVAAVLVVLAAVNLVFDGSLLAGAASAALAVVFALAGHALDDPGAV